MNCELLDDILLVQSRTEDHGITGHEYAIEGPDHAIQESHERVGEGHGVGGAGLEDCKLC